MVPCLRKKDIAGWISRVAQCFTSLKKKINVWDVGAGVFFVETKELDVPWFLQSVTNWNLDARLNISVNNWKSSFPRPLISTILEGAHFFALTSLIRFFWQFLSLLIRTKQTMRRKSLKKSFSLWNRTEMVHKCACRRKNNILPIKLQSLNRRGGSPFNAVNF